MDTGVDGCTGGWVAGWVDGWLNGWMGGYELKTRLISTRVVPLFLFLSQARTSTGSRLITLKTQKKRHRYLVFYHSLRSLLCRLTVIYSFFYFLVSFHSATSKKFNINLFVVFFPISYRKKLLSSVILFSTLLPVSSNSTFGSLLFA